ncbi:MAG: energy-coupling factor transporter transmembrane protein EcfT [Spirochaetaceae bacterium]|jgi:biotin transport system permease protein|nr:energy-coupling factor transporter transmembrane protein EcfT [Spirochaetaceae bacterium]
MAGKPRPVKRPIPWQYRPGNTLLHRLPGGLKLLTLLLFSAAPFFFGPPALVLAGVFVVTGAVSAGIRPWELLRGSRPLAAVVLLTALIRSLDFSSRGSPGFSKPGFAEALWFAGTILLSFSAGALLFSVTTMTELKDSLGKTETLLLRPLALLPGASKNPRFRETARRPGRLSLGISLMLGFLPRFFQVWDGAKDAYTARAGKGGIPQLIVLIPLVTERMMEMASETAAALESRGLDL